MASSKEKMEKSFKKIQSKLQKAPRKIKAQSQQISAQISAQIAERIGTQFTAQLNAVLSSKASTQAQEAVKSATQTVQATATMATQLATETAKHGIDQVLLNLEHRGVNFKESQDLAVKVGRKVLERAEAIREQIAANPLSPAWLKDVSLKPIEAKTAPTEDALDLATATAEGMAEPKHEHVATATDEKPEIEASEAQTEHAPKKARKKSNTSASRASK
jgi:hypothetical protein